MHVKFSGKIGLMSRVLANGQEDSGSIPGQVIPKTQKWYLMPPCLTLSIIRQGISGKIPGMEYRFGVVAIEKKVFGSPSTKVANFTYKF